MLGLSQYPHYPSDRYSMLVGIGWSILLAGLFATLWPRLEVRRVLILVLALLLPMLCLISYRQSFVWQTSTSLFRHIIAHLPEEPRLAVGRLDFYNRLARAHQQRGELADAAQPLRAAIRLRPDFAQGHYQLGEILAAAGDPDTAKACYERALRLDAGLPPVFNDLGVAYAKKGRLDQAVAQFNEALALQPNNRSALQNLATALTMQGKTNEAKRHLARLKQID
jgi:tetratricopeptide (TPR) repeat protein